MKSTRTAPLILLGLLVASGCRDSSLGPDKNMVPGNPVQPTLPPEVERERDEITAKLKEVENLTTAEFLARHEARFAALSHRPSEAGGLPLIQGSAMALSSEELDKLDANGFVISEGKRFPSFTHGYETLYLEDLPLFISADSILHAVHRSYDDILKAIELASLIPELERMLTRMRQSLADGAGAALGAQARADADTYLAVALSLLRDRTEPPVAGGSASDIQQLVEGAKTANGWHSVVLFGVERNVDFSQFEPRGHYTDSPELEKYFRSMMWLGRIDFRLIETQPDLSQVFHRRQLEGALALHAAMDATALSAWERIDTTIGAFVGEPDNMTISEVQILLEKLGVRSLDQLGAIDDATIAQTILDEGLGTQRISSHIMINGVGRGTTMPLSSTFLLLGQRYVVDSHVFSNVVYDRVQGGSVYRMMPNPLDVAFAVLENDQAGHLLESELEQYHYAPDLASMRILVDAHDEAYWQKNLYNLWLSALRALTPDDGAVTEPWGRRILNTQLASWAELRHDTILYAKQSYTAGAACEFPDARVEDAPELFAKLEQFATRGQQLVQNLDLANAPFLNDQIARYFDHLLSVSSMLREMAEYQRDGIPFTDYHMAFVNEAVAIQQGCGEPAGATGWYARLFFENLSSVEYDPTIADVHTQPTDEVGTPVGRVLHVGTGMPRLMVVTVDTCQGPRAYAGLASSYFEMITQNFDRYTDPRWAAELQQSTPPEVPWMRDLVVR